MDDILSKYIKEKKPCPACGRKGLHYAGHPHAFGWKDYSKIECRFCKKSFKAKEKKSEE